MSVCSVRRSVKGGQITTSTSSKSSFSIMYESFCTTWIATRWSWCIFQFAAMIGFRLAGSVTWISSSWVRRESVWAIVPPLGALIAQTESGRASSGVGGGAEGNESGEVTLLDEL